MFILSILKNKRINLQAESAVAITPAVTILAPGILFVGTGGAGKSVTVTTINGEAGVEFKNVPSGTILPVLVKAVTAATATDLIMLY